MNLQKSKFTQKTQIPTCINTLLMAVGVPRNIACISNKSHDTNANMYRKKQISRNNGLSTSFWNRTDLYEVFKLASKTRMELIKKYHPDKPDGDIEKMTYINLCWDRLERSARRKGYEI